MMTRTRHLLPAKVVALLAAAPVRLAASTLDEKKT
jgi:hypothetical protein